MATPRSTESTAHLRTAPPHPSGSISSTASCTSTTAPLVDLTHPTRPQRTRRSTPIAMAGRARHRRSRATPVPLDHPTTSAASPSSPQPLWHPQPDPAPLLPSLHHRAMGHRTPPPAIKSTPHPLSSPHIATTSHSHPSHPCIARRASTPPQPSCTSSAVHCLTEEEVDHGRTVLLSPSLFSAPQQPHHYHRTLPHSLPLCFVPRSDAGDSPELEHG